MNTPPPPLLSQNQPTTAKRPHDRTTVKPLDRTAKTPFQLGSLYQNNRGFKSELQPKISSRFQPEFTNATKLTTRHYPSTSQRHISRSNGDERSISETKSYLVSRLGNILGPKKVEPKKVEPKKVEPKKVEPKKVEIKRVEPEKVEDAPKTTAATVAPMSVSQYTQPTPYHNRTPYHMSRTQSEPSIKYQVQVNDKTYKVLRKIGSGGSAKVYEGFEPQTSQTVAIKIINVAKADQRTQESYFNEKNLLYMLRDSKHVVRMYACEYKADCKELVIVMEKGDADLAQVIDSHFKSNDRSSIDGIFIKFYWRGMVQAVNDIHKRGIVHADLKPVNFILVKNEIKLIDFGIANAVDPNVTSIVRDYQIGTINYMAPEALRNRALDASFQHLNIDVDENNQPQKKTVIKYNSKVDIWSLGCILYNLVYGRPPFDDYQDILSKVKAISNPRQISFPQISNPNLLNCMKSCLRYNPADRPTAEELLNHPYLNEDKVCIQK